MLDFNSCEEEIVDLFVLTQKFRGEERINYNNLKMLGSLLSGLSPEQIDKIAPEDVVDHLVQLSNTPSREKLELLLRKVKSSFKQRYVQSQYILKILIF